MKIIVNIIISDRDLSMVSKSIPRLGRFSELIIRKFTTIMMDYTPMITL